MVYRTVKSYRDTIQLNIQDMYVARYKHFIHMVSNSTKYIIDYMSFLPANILGTQKLKIQYSQHTPARLL